MRTLYTSERSGHSHTVRNFLSILGLEYQPVQRSTKLGETRTEEYARINPFMQIPVLDDDGFIVRDSHAILYYLAAKYDPHRKWLPDDVHGATRVQEWLATSTLDLVIGVAWARGALRFGRPFDVQKAQERARQLFERMDRHLAGREWLAVDHASIADLSMYTYSFLAPEGGIPLSEYANVQSWMGRVQSIPGFVPMKQYAD